MTIFEQLKSIPVADTARALGFDVIRKGHREWMCCPFHGERTPSMLLNEGERGFYCFGCHASGDSVAFVQRVKGYSRPIEAARDLQGMFGIFESTDAYRPHQTAANDTKKMLEAWRSKKHSAFCTAIRGLNAKIATIEAAYNESGDESLFEKIEALLPALMYAEEQAEFFETASVEELAAQFIAEKEGAAE